MSEPVFQITSKWTYLRPQKVPSASKFWNKDVSKCPEFLELCPKFEFRLLGGSNTAVLMFAKSGEK